MFYIHIYIYFIFFLKFFKNIVLSNSWTLESGICTEVAVEAVGQGNMCIGEGLLLNPEDNDHVHLNQLRVYCTEMFTTLQFTV